jgi:hypothetical protein
MIEKQINEINSALNEINSGIAALRTSFPHRHFTIDGRLVGDIGEVIAAREFAIILDGTAGSQHAKSRPHYDAVTRHGKRNVQIKATFKKSLTFTTVSELYLGIQIFENGDHEVVFNGPGQLIFDRYKHRAGIGEKLLSFPVSELKKLNSEVSESSRVPTAC